MTKEIENKEIKEKLKHIGLNLEKIPKFLKESEEITFRPTKIYDETSYKIYKYINIKDIEILIAPFDRLEDIKTKYKKSSPILEYIEPKSEENIEKYLTFIKMLTNLDLGRLQQLEEEQEKLSKKIPFEVKYKDNFIWQIYYSESADKYFMLFPSNETRTESLFYLLKKKIEINKSRKKEDKFIYVPICNMDYESGLLKKSEITDLENYLWFFTGEWPNIYEVTDKENNTKVEITGITKVYEKIKSIYKISLKDKKSAQEQYKLIKALFILKSYDKELYDFKTIINEEGSLEFCYNLRKIKYQNLPEFIESQVLNKVQELNSVWEELILGEEKLEILKNSVQKQNDEFLAKERQIVMFLECKKTFFGKIKYFFKGKKTKTNKEIKLEKPKQEQEEKKIQEYNFEKKETYTIEDLLVVCKNLEEKKNRYKNVLMDIKALENKKENLERKIKNATLYINEIESHKKSIFDFWKFTSKDEVTLLNESESKEEEKENKIKRTFNYEEDLEEFGKKIDDKQRNTFSKNECDAVFAVKEDIDTFNIMGKAKILKKDDTLIKKNLNKQISEYNKNIDKIEEKDFDIFGNIVEDKTKIKSLKNEKHREIEKDKYKILNIKPETTVEDYKENVLNYYRLLKEAYGKVTTPYDMQIYKLSNEEIKENGFEIFNINPEAEMMGKEIEEDNLNLIRLDIKEKMPVIFYSNIMFYDNLNETLPLGMDLSTKVLIDLDEFEIKLVSRKDFNMNITKDEYESEVKTIKLYEYSVERKTKND